MDDNNSEIRKIRIELQWLSWGLVKVPLIALGLFAIYSLLNRSGGDVEEANSGAVSYTHLTLPTILLV